MVLRTYGHQNMGMFPNPCRWDRTYPHRRNAHSEGKIPMTFMIETQARSSGNPLDTVEHFISQQDWNFDRHAEEELAVAVSGRWCEYHLWFCWRPEHQSLHLSCAFDLKVPDEKQNGVYALLALMNGKVGIGNFDLYAEEGAVVYRNALLLRGCVGVAESQVEDMMELALSESERFYPALQFLLWGGSTPEQALLAAVMEPVGEA